MGRTITEMLKEYVQLVWNMFDMRDSGIFGIYGLEQHRIRLHDSICQALAIDRVKSKDILSSLDTTIGLDLSISPSDQDLQMYAERLYSVLRIEKGKGNI